MTEDEFLARFKNVINGIVEQPAGERERDMSVRQIAVLMHLEPKGDHTVRGLAEALVINKPSITRAVDRLMELGLAERTPDPADGRSVLVKRTKAGNEFLRQIAKRGARDPHTPRKMRLPAVAAGYLG